MSHVDEYEDIDREASLWALAALISKGSRYGITIEEMCRVVRRPLPVSAEDFAELASMCRRWDVKTNMDGEPVWQKTRREMDPIRAAQQEREDKFDKEMDRQREEDSR